MSSLMSLMTQPQEMARQYNIEFEIQSSKYNIPISTESECGDVDKEDRQVYRQHKEEKKRSVPTEGIATAKQQSVGN